jgi:hypothetical protein
MSDSDAQHAQTTLDQLHGKTLDEAAQTYLFGVLQADLPEDVEERWQASFESGVERNKAEQALQRLGQHDRETLLRMAMDTTLDEHPETAPLFDDAVNQAGQSLFVVEIAALALAAALLIREAHAKGRQREVTRTETVDPDGRRTIQTREVQYATGGPLAELLSKIGIGS